MRVALLRTEGYGLEAEIDVDGCRLRVMDAISPIEEPAAPGPVRDPIFTAVVVAPDSWTRAVSENPECEKRLEPSWGWRHRGYCEIVSLDPLRADLGVLVLELDLPPDTARKRGDFVALAIDRIRIARAPV
jgi:hypothetical protein